MGAFVSVDFVWLDRLYISAATPVLRLFATPGFLLLLLLPPRLFDLSRIGGPADEVSRRAPCGVGDVHRRSRGVPRGEATWEHDGLVFVVGGAIEATDSRAKLLSACAWRKRGGSASKGVGAGRPGGVPGIAEASWRLCL